MPTGRQARYCFGAEIYQAQCVGTRPFAPPHPGQGSA